MFHYVDISVCLCISQWVAYSLLPVWGCCEYCSTNICASLCAHTVSFLLGKCHKVEYLGHRRGACYKINATLFSKVAGIWYGLQSVQVFFFLISPETSSLTCGLFKSSLFRFQVFWDYPVLFCFSVGGFQFGSMEVKELILHDLTYF